MNERGAMHVSLEEHILTPEIFPGAPDGSDLNEKCEELLMAIQTSIPFEMFDPDDTLVGTSFIDPQLRIARVVGDKYPNIYNVFLRVEC